MQAKEGQKKHRSNSTSVPEKPSSSKGGQVARQTDRNVPFSAFGTFGNTDFLSDEAFPKYHHRSEPKQQRREDNFKRPYLENHLAEF